ncbi:hypothetical protein ACHAWU_001346 [Discostella pseudostelligera]|uniref:Uncharacterized protein n=1 Tax=Discostella pseudostelligera TaxID=259834 RepID=A0ABD3LYJ7_9STRA
MLSSKKSQRRNIRDIAPHASLPSSTRTFLFAVVDITALSTYTADLCCPSSNRCLNGDELLTSREIADEALVWNIGR